ncbi:hypothetical protein FB45DRAFT_894295 [Roridomyces roridus]|uniref:Uncharacterized protein n=1 Tax=Roridomyces roridus TaxID=1738132 RepID=A0AAD7FZK2_9AGAR|nr:hypothetical protein FB45DRAFT_894295 [Roridomyces roridus]
MDTQQLPRIEIPSMRVWLRLKSDFAQKTRDTLLQDAKRRNLSEAQTAVMLNHGQEFVDRTFTIAQHNIRINGRDYDTLQLHEQDAEPFDEVLDRRVWALADSRLKLHSQIAGQRRETPSELAKDLQPLLDEWGGLDAEDVTPDEDDDMDSEPQFPLDGEVVAQLHAVVGELGQGIPGQHARSERSRAVEAEYKALKS